MLLHCIARKVTDNNQMLTAVPRIPGAKEVERKRDREDR